MNTFDIKSLHRQHDIRRASRMKYYDQVLTRCKNRIQFISSIHSYTTECLFQIPEFIIGLPPHDMHECGNYLNEELTKSGFFVKRYDNHIFHISWGKDHVPKHYLEQNQNNTWDEVRNGVRDEKISTKKIKRPMHTKEIDTYKPSGSFLYENMWDRVDRNSKIILNSKF